MDVSNAQEAWIGTAIALVLALAIAAAIVAAVWLVAALVSRRVPWVRDLERRIRRTSILVLALVTIWIACAATAPAAQDWWPAVSHLFLIATIVAGAWMLAALVSFGFERVMGTEAQAVLFDAGRRRRRTQLIVLHRLTLALIGILALGAVLFTFPELRVVGTSLLASAGIGSIVAGLAAQSILGNLIAGIQLAFTDAVRVGDVVVVAGEWGRIGEINLSYVVVYIWDERRLVVPCSYFTSNPIETWTRKSDEVLGIVYMDLDWRVPVAAVRERFAEIIEETDAWDRRSSSVYVTGSEGGFVTVRFVASAKNSDDQWVLRCHIREQMVAWLQQEHPDALPRTRVAVEQSAS